MSDNQIITPDSQASQASQEAPKKTRVIIGLPGDHFSQSFLLSWTQALHVLISSNRYDIIVSPGKSSFVSFARMQTLGLDVRRGKNQKPFNGDNYDIYVTIDSDVVFSPSQLIELIECTKLHPVVSGYYMMSNNKQFAVVKDWNKDYFAKNGTFPFLEPKDTEEAIKKFVDEIEARKAAEEAKKELPSISEPEFTKVSYAGMGFFACRKEVLDDLSYPYFNRELQRIRGKDGVEMVDMCSEDVAFCKNIEDAGYDIMLNTRLRVGHEKAMIL
jgi:cellulose synthase/poly-beta-1,6-N-acetylglucosamine synthase-like glycosyltransferase